MQTNDEQTDGLLVTGFRLGKAAFGIDARLVLEVVKVGELTAVHRAPAGVIGIRNLRGRIVTVIDLATHLNLGAVQADERNRLLIMEDQGESYGFLVDAVDEALTLDADRISPAPASLAPALRHRLRGVWSGSERLTAILEPQTLFQWEDVVA
jgi:purine-binding chemotaxis protein CheW